MDQKHGAAGRSRQGQRRNRKQRLQPQLRSSPTKQKENSDLDHGIDSNTNLGHAKPAMEFKKRSGTTDVGKDYEHLYIANLILRLILDDNVEDFYLSSNDEAFGAFDDVVVEIKYVGQEQTVVYAIQLKHGNEKTLETKHLIAPKGNFSLNKYYSEHTFNPKVKMILFTNYNSNFTEKTAMEIILSDKNKETHTTVNLEMLKNEQSQLLKTSEQGVCYQFRSDKSNTFFENVALYTKQVHVTTLKTQVLDLFREKFAGDENIFKKFIDFIVQWSMNEKKKNKLDKIWMKKQLFVLLSSPFIKQLSFSPNATVDGRKKIFRDAFTKFGMLRLDTQNYRENIEFLWQDVLKDVNVLPQINELNQQKYLLSSRLIQNQEDLKGEDKDINQLLWLLEKCPLILEGCPQVYKAIEVCTSKNIIILNDSEDLKTTAQFRNLLDLKPYSEIYEEIIDTFTYSIEGQVETPLKELLTNNEELEREITTDKLAEMIIRPLQIGYQIEELPLYYVPRRLTKIVMDFEFLNKLPKNTIAVITHVNDNNELRQILNTKTLDQISSDDNVVYVSRTGISNEDFIKICSKNPKTCIHHFKYLTTTQLEWTESKHSCVEETNQKICFEELYKFYLKNEQTNHVLSESEIFDENENSINIICANPGTGKSTLTKSLKNNCCSKVWTVVIHAINYGKEFRNFKTNVDDFLNHILNEKLKRDNIEKEVLKINLSKKRIRLIWDGLDEVSETSLKIILSLVKQISAKGIKQWLTSRNNLKNRLETRFQTFARDLEQFDEQEQKAYIGHRLKLADVELSEIFLKIESNIKMFSNNDILGIPLQIFMLTELLLNHRNKYLKLLNEIFTILDLYKHFVKQKIQICFEEKLGHDLNNDQIIEKIKKNKKKQIQCYQKIAFNVHLKEYLKNLDILIKSKSNFDKYFNVGLIKPTTNVNDVEFVHNSYGEYFAALYLFENNPNITREFFFISNKKLNNIRFFLDLKLARKSKPAAPILYRNYTLFEQCSEEELNTRDSIGRDLLELSCAWNKQFSNLDESSFPHFNNVAPVDYSRIKSKFDKVNLSLKISKKKMLLFYPPLIPFYDEECQDFDQHELSNILNYLICSDNATLFDLLQTSPQFKSYYNNFEPYNFLSRVFCSRNLLQKVFNDYKFGERINILDSKGFLPIHYACQNDDSYKILLVELMLEKGAKIDVPDLNGALPIHYACRNSTRCKTVLLLLEKGAKINVPDFCGALPIHYACQNKGANGPIIVQSLLDNKARIDVPDSNGLVPIHYACQNSKGYEIVSLLLKKGARIDVRDRKGIMPIHYACQNFSGYKTVQLLLEKGTKLDVPDSNGVLPIHYACQNYEGYEIVKSLLENGVRIDVPDASGVLPIHYACQNSEDDKMVLLLLEKGAGIDVPDSNGVLPIHYACQNFSGYETIELLLVNGAKLDLPDSNGVLPIHYACQIKSCNSYLIVLLLLEKGSKINVPNSNGVLPLHYACQNFEGYETVQLFLKMGARIDVPDWNGVLPIHYACQNSEGYEIVKLLLEKCAKINVPDLNGVLPIHYACQRSSGYKTVELLLKNGAKIHAPDWNGVLPIHYACKNFMDFKTVQLLLEKGARIDVSDSHGVLPIHYACQNEGDCGYVIVQLLLEKGARMDVPDSNGVLPIHSACQNESDYGNEIAELLLEKGARLDVPDSNGVMPIHYACQNKNDYAYEIVQLLLEKGARLDVPDSNGILPIHYACQNSEDHETVQLLLEKGSRIDVSDLNGVLPIHYACQNEGDCGYEIVQLLLKKGARIDVPDSNGILPIHYACQYSLFVKTVELLLEKGARTDVSDSNGVLPIHFACQNEGNYSCKLVQLLLKKGGRLDVPDSKGVLPIHYACQNSDDHKTVQFLLENGARTDVSDSNGVMPIHYACQNKNDYAYEIVQVLLEKGARIDLPDSTGVLPIHYACQNKNDYSYEIVQLLLEKGARLDLPDSNGVLPIYYAYQYCKGNRTVKLLLKKGAKINFSDLSSVFPK